MNNVGGVIKSLVAAIALLALFAGCNTKGNSTPKSDATAIADQPRDSMVILLRAGDSTTVFELLRNSHNVDYQPSVAGVFVKGIDSIYGSSAAFWVYSVNDSMPEIAADKFTVHAGDIVRWHLRKSTP